MGLYKVAIEFNEKMESSQQGFYATIEDKGFTLSVFLDGHMVLKIDQNKRIKAILKPGLSAYRELIAMMG